jgi:hypothetical protein
MGHRRQQLERLLAHPDPLVRLVAADELARELRVLERESAVSAHRHCALGWIRTSDARFRNRSGGDALSAASAKTLVSRTS